MYVRIGGNPVATYGDHASIHSVVYDDIPIMRWSARIDYPQSFQWIFERRSGDQTQGGFISAAKEIVQQDTEIGSRNIWGEQMICDAAQGAPYGAAPSSWIAVRVNIHLSRQIDLSSVIERQSDAEEDDEL